MSKTTFDIAPAYRELLAAHGLDSFDALFQCQSARQVDGHRDRSVARLVLKDASGTDLVFYLKREWNPKLAMLLRRMLVNWLRPPPSRAMHELKNLDLLRNRDIAAAEPAAVGEVRQGAFFTQALLLVREVPEALNLADYLGRFPAQPTAAERATKRDLARELGAYIRRMHDAGMAYRDLYAKHIYISPGRPGGSFRPTLIDAQRAHRFPNLTPQFRWNDLAALLVTTEYPACSAADRLRFILAYGRQSRLSDGLKLMIRQTVARAGKFRGRGLDPRLAPGRHEALPGHVALMHENLLRLDGNRLVVSERFLPELRRLKLDTFEAVMGYSGGRAYRDVPDRLTVRLPITGPDSRPSAIYLKRHQRVDWAAWCEGLFFWRKPETRAQAEYRNILHLATNGFAVPTVVALGEEQRWSVRQRSFLMTEEIPGGRPADDYLKDRFADKSEQRLAAKRHLIREIARLARRFHGDGFYHRDFYLCHIFVRELGPLPAGKTTATTTDCPSTGSGSFDKQSVPHGGAGCEIMVPFVLYLIDLQRVRHAGPGKVGRRWIVKDLAQLNYSSRLEMVSRTDRLRFLKEYLGLKRHDGACQHAPYKLDGAARELAAEVVAKTNCIARHDAKHQARKA